MGRFVILVEFDLRPEGSERFLDLVRENAAASLRDEEGCERFDVLVPASGPNKVVLYEIYRDRAAFDLHLRTPHFAEFDSATRSIVVAKGVTEYVLD
jgi:quinol monooxygenase YgiN